MEEEERMMMSSLLPLLRECVPDAASEIESEIDNYIFKGGMVKFAKCFNFNAPLKDLN